MKLSRRDLACDVGERVLIERQFGTVTRVDASDRGDIYRVDVLIDGYSSPERYGPDDLVTLEEIQMIARGELT